MWIKATNTQGDTILVNMDHVHLLREGEGDARAVMRDGSLAHFQEDLAWFEKALGLTGPAEAEKKEGPRLPAGRFESVADEDGDWLRINLAGPGQLAFAAGGRAECDCALLERDDVERLVKALQDWLKRAES